MASKYSITKDLFRFATYRSPEHLDPGTRSLRFVTHPNLQVSLASSCPYPQVPAAKTIPDPYSGYLNQFPKVNSFEEIRKINTPLYDLGSRIIKKKMSILDIHELQLEMRLLDLKEIVHIFDILFYQVLTGTNPRILQACNQMLIVNHVVKNSKALLGAEFNKFQDIKIEIPDELIRCYKYWNLDRCGGELNGVQNLGIADFRRVEQEVCCYVPGEVSHIENIMAREYKERSTRNLVRSEFTTESTRETEIESLSDVTSTSRNELSSEIATVLDQERSASYGGSLGVSGKKFGITIDANAYADFASSNSSSYSNTAAKTYAEEVTNRALERIVQKTSEKRTSKMIKEFEENNKHGFDNRAGNEHVTGIYRWIDVIYKNRLVNYGKRLMIEFMVPEPAAFIKRAMKYVPVLENDPNSNLEEPQAPKSLEDMGINSFKDINRSNFATLGQEYGIQLNGPKEEYKNVSQAFSPVPPIKHNGPDWTQQFSISIDPDYLAESVSGNYSFRWKARTGEKAHWYYNIGGLTGGRGSLRGGEQTTTGGISGMFNPKIANTVPVTFTGDKCYTYGVQVTIACKLSDAIFEAWQTESYTILQDAYQSLLDQFNEQQEQDAAEAAASEETKPTNPALNRITEQRELKRACIEMISKPYCIVQGKKMYTDEDACKKYSVPKVAQTAEFKQYTSEVKFFEQAFDWTIMSYLFYPYYWADKCDWADLIQSDDADLIYQAFLQSGMARVVVPVRPEFTEAVAYYLETGKIWLGNDLVPGTNSDLYLSIVEEMQTVEGAVEEEWLTRVPTTLAIIQGKSAFLQEEGLPCCSDVENPDTTTNVIGSSALLELIKP